MKWLVHFEHCSDDKYNYDRVLDQEADAWAWAAAVAMIFQDRCDDSWQDPMWDAFKARVPESAPYIDAYLKARN